MILVDTGPIVALFDRDDKYHSLCLQILEKLDGPLVTTWPVLTECFYLLGFSWEAQDDLWTFLTRGGLDLFPMDRNHFLQCRDLPMDFADASLVVHEIRDCRRHLVPSLFGNRQVFAPGRRQRVILRALLVLGLPPFRFYPALFLQPVQCRVERAGFEPDRMC